MKKQLMHTCCISILCLSLLDLNGQTIVRETLSSSGSSSGEGIVVQQSIGQPFGTSSTAGSGFAYRPGFIQPSVFSVEETKPNISLKVYPNPATRLVTIECSEKIPDGILWVSNLSGQLLRAIRVNDMEKLELECEGWANGTYILSINSNKVEVYSAKLIIIN